MPSASSYTNKIRFAASVKNTKAQLPGGVGNITQPSAAGCGLSIQYNPIDYVEICECNVNPPSVPPPPPPQLYITTIAGNGVLGYSGDGTSAISAGLNYPVGLAVDSAGNVYIVDTDNNRIRKITNGIITTIAGTGEYGYDGDGSSAIGATFRSPLGVAVDSSGNVYIADTDNHRIRKITNGTITTIAGNGVLGYSGDGGSAISAQLKYPYGVAVDSAGNVYIADTENNRIRKITNGIITTIAGTGEYGYDGDDSSAIGATFRSPNGLAVDSSGNVYIADTVNHSIRKITNGIITTIAGTGSPAYNGDGISAIGASLNNPSSVEVDSAGNVYIADQTSNRIRKITNGIITTIAGPGGIIPDVNMIGPRGMTLDSSGNVYIADTNKHRVLKLYYA